MSEIEYIEIPIETDPEILAQEGFDYIQAQIPDWVPNDANLETIMIEAHARISAEARDAASAVPTDIFRKFGQLVGILPKEASKAEATTTWTMTDNAGYTIPAGTQVGIRTSGDTLIPFEILEDTVISPGATTATLVEIQALEAGSDASGLPDTSSIELIDTLDFVSLVDLTSITSGGEDAELTDAYLNRLVARLQLLAPRPILARDFAVFAQDIAGVARAVALDNYIPGTNEKQQVAITGAPTGGTFTLTFDPPPAGGGTETTGVIQWNSTAAQLKTILEALATPVPGDIETTGGPLPTTPIVVEFKGQFREVDVPALTIAANSLTGGTTPEPVITTVTPGVPPVTNADRAVTIAAVDTEGEPVSSTIKNAVDAYLESLREVNFLIYMIDPLYTTIDVNFTAVAKEGWLPADVDAAATQVVTDYLSPDQWGLPDIISIGDVPIPGWELKTTVRYLELAAVLDGVAGLDYLTILEFRKGSDAFAKTDIVLSGPIPLPRSGIIAGTVT
jgi:hypothetical protein